MLNQTKSLRLIVPLVVFLTAFLLMFAAMSIAANAHEGEDHGDDTSVSSEDKPKTREEILEKRKQLLEERQERIAERKEKAEDRKKQAGLRLGEARLKGCEARESAINNAMDRIATRIERHKSIFDTISERTQAFYADNNLSLDNYDLLIENVNSKKAIAESAIEEFKASDADFQCDSEDPLGIADTFKGAREEVAIAMKDYKTAIKELIVGVKSAASESEES